MELRKEALTLGEQVEYIERFGLTEDDERPTVAIVAEYQKEATRIKDRLKGLGSYLRSFIPLAQQQEEEAETRSPHRVPGKKRVKKKKTPMKAMKKTRKS